jgi:5-methylcytosine-specific restriction endonuclease McrA
MRELPEWIGATPDSKVPPRVRLRVFYRDDGTCQCGCGRLIHAGEKWQTDHTIALINGGENRERNLRTLLVKHHAAKTKEDVAQKSKDYRVRAKHNGIRKPSRFPGSRDSRWKKKIDGSVVLR